MPRYDVGCTECGVSREQFLSYTEYDDITTDTHGDRGDLLNKFLAPCEICRCNTIQELLFSNTMPAVSLKGYGFNKTDTAPPDERFMRDHYDGSGRNAEMKAIQRRIKHPESTLPLTPNKSKG